MKLATKVLNHLRGMSGYNRSGQEIPDPVPTALRIDLEASMPLHEKVLRAVRSEAWSQRMQAQGKETFDEANDFDVPSDIPEFQSIHEEDSGDMIAHQEGVRAGFIEEIPETRIHEARQSVKDAQEALENKKAMSEVAKEQRRDKYRNTAKKEPS